MFKTNTTDFQTFLDQLNYNNIQLMYLQQFSISGEEMNSLLNRMEQIAAANESNIYSSINFVLNLSTIDSKALENLANKISEDDLAKKIHASGIAIELVSDYEFLFSPNDSKEKENLKALGNILTKSIDSLNNLHVILVLPYNEKLPVNSDKLSLIIKTMQSNPWMNGLDLSNQNLGTLSQPVFTELMNTLSTITQLSYLKLNNNSLASINDNACLKKCIFRLLNSLPLNTLGLNNNELWKMEGEALVEIATTIQNKLELTEFGFLLDDLTSSDAQSVISKWSASAQEKLIEAQFIIHSGKHLLRYTIDKQLFFFSVQEQRVIELVTVAVEKNPSLYSKLSDSWIHSYPFLKQCFIQNLFLKDIENRIKQFDIRQFIYCIRFNIHLNTSEIKLDEKCANDLVEMLANKKITEIALTITFSETSTQEEIIHYAQMINRLKLKASRSHLILKSSVNFSNTSNVSKNISIFFDHFNNVGFENIEIGPNILGFATPTILNNIINHIKKNDNLKQISLTSQNLHFLGEEQCINIISLLADNKNLTSIYIAYNNLVNFGTKFLLSLANIAFSKNKVFLGLFDNSEIDILQKIFNELDSKNKIKLAKLYYTSLIFSSDAPPYMIDLTPKENDILLTEMAPQLSNPNETYRFMTLISHINLESKDKMKYLTKMNFSTLAWNSKNVSEYKLELSDRLDLFMAFIADHDRNDHYILRRIEHFDLKDHPAYAFFSAWIEEKNKNNNNLDEDQNFYEDPDFDVIAEKFQQIYIQKLEKACESYWPIPSFASICLSSIKSHQNDEPLPLLNMGLWFTWVCAKLISKPEIIKDIFIMEKNNLEISEDNASSSDNNMLHYYLALTEDLAYQPVENVTNASKITAKTKQPPKTFLPVFNQVLKEILNFANPNVRYTLTSTFIDTICNDANSRKLSTYP